MKGHLADKVIWPDGVSRPAPTCMVERRDLPEPKAHKLTDDHMLVTCKRCHRWMIP